MTDAHDAHPAGSAYLHTELRSRERAALDEAVKALTLIRRFKGRTLVSHNAAGDALDRIAAILPEAVK